MAVSIYYTSTQIYTSGSGDISLNDVYNGVGNDAVMSRSDKDVSNGTYVFTIHGNREIEIRSGAILNIDGDTIGWNLSSAKYPVLEIQGGGVLNIYGGSEIVGDINYSSYCYMYFWGNTNLIGEEGNEIKINGIRQLRFYSSSTSSYHDWSHIKIDRGTYQYGSALYLNAYNAHYKLRGSFRNIEVDGSNGSGFYSAIECVSDTSKIEFDNIVSKYCYYGIRINNAILKISNSIFQNPISNSILAYEAGNCISRNRYNTENQLYVNLNIDNNDYQSICVFDNCTFDEEGGSYACYNIQKRSVIILKDCTFQNCTSYSTLAYYGGILIFQGTQTYNNVGSTKVYNASGATHLHSKTLNLTVKDEKNNLVKNAFVGIYQSESRENWHFMTGINGSITNVFGDLPVFIHREETSNNNFTNWSDSIESGRFHWVIISKPGYKIWQRKVIFDTDLEINAVLQKESGKVSLPIQY